MFKEYVFEGEEIPYRDGKQAQDIIEMTRLGKEDFNKIFKLPAILRFARSLYDEDYGDKLDSAEIIRDCRKDRERRGLPPDNDVEIRNYYGFVIETRRREENALNILRAAVRLAEGDSEIRIV